MERLAEEYRVTPSTIEADAKCIEHYKPFCLLMDGQRNPMQKAIAGQLTIALVYARVSSKEQEKEGFSIPAQLKLLRGYAADQGFTLVEEFVDVETAKRTGRPGFTAMVEFFKKHGKAKSPENIRRILLVEKTDRLYRNLKDWVTLGDIR